jgi:glycosyltransferase involved in cell wall biosynthesis
MTLNLAVYSSPLRAISKPTGVGQHIVQMVEHLADRDGVSPSLLATRDDYRQVYPYLSKRLAGLPVNYLPRAERLVRAFLLSTNLVSIERWSGNVDWIYCPKEQPVATKRARLAVTVHDVLAFEPAISGMERRISFRSRARWRLIMKRILKRADLIATVSEFTRQRLIELCGIRDEKRLVVVGNGVASCYFQSRQSDDVQILEQFGIQPDSYLMSIGSLTFRKGGDLLLDLAQQLRKRKLPWRILVTGQRHDADLLRRYQALKADIPDLPLELPGYVSNDEQAVLLRNALTMVFPSRYEGFGIPVLEAMAAGTPVICSQSAALPEVAGEAAMYCESNHPEEWLDRLLTMANGSGVREQFIDSGLSRAREFTWGRCVSRLVNAMQQS